MAEALAHPTPLPKEIIARTECFWLRSPDVALGVYQEGGEFFYWKWNLKASHWRVTPMSRDTKLFPNFRGASPFTSRRTQVIRYKPESRLAFRSQDMPGKFLKLYRPDKFEIASQRAQIFSRAFTHAAPMCSLNSNENRIDWIWIEGGAFSADYLYDRDRVLDLLQSRNESSSCGLRILDSFAVAEHIAERIETHNAWMRILSPSAADELEGITRAWPQLAAALVQAKSSAHTRLLHGDFRPRNVICSTSADMYLCDSDHVCAGPLEWDLAAWAADLSFRNHDHATELLTNWFSLEDVNASLLSNFFRAWRILIGLRSIMERHS